MDEHLLHTAADQYLASLKAGEADARAKADELTAEAVAKERERLQYKKKYNRTLRSTIYALLVVAALAVLVATIFLPVLAHELSE